MDEKADRKKIFWRYAGYIAGTLGIGSLSALLSRGGMEAFSYLKNRHSLRRSGYFRRRGRCCIS